MEWRRENNLGIFSTMDVKRQEGTVSDGVRTTETRQESDEKGRDANGDQIELLLLRLQETENFVEKLESTNMQLRQLVAGQGDEDGGAADPEYRTALDENMDVLKKKTLEIQALRQQIETLQPGSLPKVNRGDPTASGLWL